MSAQRPLSADTYKFLYIYIHFNLLLIVCQYIFIVLAGRKQECQSRPDFPCKIVPNPLQFYLYGFIWMFFWQRPVQTSEYRPRIILTGEQSFPAS